MSLQGIKKIAAASIAASLIATPAYAQPVQAEPAGRWALDYADMACNLQRTFKANDVVHLLRFERKPLNDSMIISVLADTRGPSGDQRKSAVIFADDAQATTVQLTRVPLAERRPRYSLELNHKRVPLAKVEQSISVDAGDMIQMRFKTGSLEAPVAALDQCIKDLYTDLNIDPATLEHIKVTPRMDRRAEERITRFLPDESYDSEKGGRLLGVLWVDAEGKIENCQLSQPADPELKAESCAIMSDKIRLSPAQIEGGQAVAAPYLLDFTTVRSKASLIRR